MTEGVRLRCHGRTKRGGPRPRRGDGPGGLCILHDPNREAEHAAYLAALGAADRRVQIQRATEVVPPAAKLATAKDIRTAPERALGAVEQSSGEEATRGCHRPAVLSGS